MKRVTGLLVLAVLLILSALGGPAHAEAPVLGAPEAYRQLKAGELILIDVRSEREWRQTGVAPGALTISIHDPEGRRGFLAKVRAAIGDDPDRPIAAICEAGIRSERTAKWLRAAGYRRVFNVREGMGGRLEPVDPEQPGWLYRGLPTQPWSHF